MSFFNLSKFLFEIPLEFSKRMNCKKNTITLIGINFATEKQDVGFCLFQTSFACSG